MAERARAAPPGGATVGRAYEVAAEPLVRERSDAPSRSALVGFYLELERIARTRLSIGKTVRPREEPAL